jgi:hypothetical protein
MTTAADRQAVKAYMSALGKKGGKAKGKRKARDPEHYARLAEMKRKAARARK